LIDNGGEDSVYVNNNLLAKCLYDLDISELESVYIEVIVPIELLKRELVLFGFK
jgi:hypothetical protein